MKKKLFSILISMVLVCSLLPATAHAATTFQVDTATGPGPNTLDYALQNVADGDTIQLMNDINYPNGIQVNTQNITFNVGQYTLTVNNTSNFLVIVGTTTTEASYVIRYDGLDTFGGSVTLNKTTGAFNIINNNISGTGVNIHSGKVEVSSISGTCFYCASVSNGTLRVYNDCTTTTGGGVNVSSTGGNASTATIDGNISSVGTGISVGGANGSATVGNVTVTGTNSVGAQAANSGTLQINGDVIASGTGGTGASAFSGGTITIEKTVTGEKYISLEFIPTTADKGVQGTGADRHYLVYADGTNTVRVKHIASAVISPVTALFDKNPAAQADVTTSVTWNSAASVTDVKAGGSSIGAGNYSVSGNTLIIKKGFLATKSTGNLNLTIEFNEENPATITIAISDSTPAKADGNIITPGSLNLNTGGRATLSPAVKNGVWTFDKTAVSLTQNADGTVTVKALKAGTTTLHYSVGWADTDVTLTIGARSLPQTGQDFTPVILLLALAGCAIMAALVYRKKKAKVQ